MKCSQCGGCRFDEDPARGDMVCVECGAVESENAVTSSVEYIENPGGTTTALGNFVSSESQMPGFRESRYITEQKARKRIETICGQLRLGADVAVSAFRYYQSALFRGFTRGRSSLQLAAACIYVAARQLRVNLMLLDLSDAVAINVYHVGRTYIDLKRRLNLSLPEVDPCLFVERFASQLDFEEKTAIVATTAMRLLQRMKKDWISTGRRPSGLAAASLLVAARIHEFNRTEEDVAKVARISQMTARKRLIEFSKTPSSGLSIDAFFTVDYDEEQDPPCFGQPTQRRRFDLKDLDMEQVSAEIKELGRRIDQELDELANKRRVSVAINDIGLANSKGLRHLVESDSLLVKDDEVVGEREEDEGAGAAVEVVAEGLSSPPYLSAATCGRSSRQVLREVLDGVVDPEILDSCVEDLELITAHSGAKLCELVRATHQWRNARDAAEAAAATTDIAAKRLDASTSQSSLSTLIPTEDSLKLPHFLTPLESAQSANETHNDSTEKNEERGYSIDLSDIDEEELNREYFLTPREVMVKATLWFRENAPFLEEQRRKKAEKRRLKEEMAKRPKRSRRGPRKIYRRQRRMPWHASSKEDGSEGGLNETEESQSQPISKKINYAALEAIVGAKAEVSSAAGEGAASATNPSSSSSLAPEIGVGIDGSAVPSPGSHAPNRLLEKTVCVSTAHSKCLPSSVSSPALLENLQDQQEEDEVASEEDDVEDELYNEQQEDSDWSEELIKYEVNVDSWMIDELVGEQSYAQLCKGKGSRFIYNKQTSSYTREGRGKECCDVMTVRTQKASSRPARGRRKGED
uniref:B-related factor 1 n=1 Tax=Echinococcus granulosus TaxID=6210 RepID=A0A068WNM7_ECHGR|nr:transcription factor iiib 90 kda subunit [Echinococcus granulosus]